MQQRGFAGAVASDDADGFAFFDLKRNILECPELPVKNGHWGVGSGEEPAQRRQRGAELRRNELLESIARAVVDLVALTEVADLDGDVVHVVWLHGFAFENGPVPLSFLGGATQRKGNDTSKLEAGGG